MNSAALRLKFSVVLASLASAVLVGCSGGAATTATPNSVNASSVVAYSGPAPQSADVQAFESNLWVNISPTTRCGNCHKAGGQSPMFARSDDINQAYQAALTVVNLSQPETSTMVQKVAGGHNCWLSSPQACADILTTWISNWAGGGSGSTGGNQITLSAPVERTVGATKVFPTDPTLFSTTVYPVLTTYCQRCHSDTAASPQAPYFASKNLATAYAAAQPKMDLNNPQNSRFYERLANESHNCWIPPGESAVDCAASAAYMLSEIEAFANGVTPTTVNSSLVVSKALYLTDGTVASGANRYDVHDIAKWTFKEGTGLTAYDTSGVDPEMDLSLSGDVSWVGGWGIAFGQNGGNGRAQASTATSTKIYNKLTTSGQYSIELWVTPANVTQTKAYIASYSGGDSSRNFTVGQAAMEYQLMARSSVSDLNGSPAMVTAQSAQTAQAALQHIVMTYDSTHGRRLYVNGVFTGDVDTSTGGVINNWDNSFAFLLGNETSGDRPWLGTVRFAAVHDAALTQQQIQQNYAAGVGETFYLLFDVSTLTNTSQSYVMFTASQYDSYSYLFSRPTFISLDKTFKPTSNIPIAGIRIGVNGQEAQVDQAYIPLSVNVDSADYSASTGQLLSPIGTVIPLENGPGSDEFFLSFATIGSNTHAYTDNPPTVAGTPSQAAPTAPDVGLRMFNEVNASMSKMTGELPSVSGVSSTYLTVQQALPATYDLNSISAAQQIASVQLAMQYCQALVNDSSLAPTFFSGFNFSNAPSVAFANTSGMDQVITPLITYFTNQTTATPLTIQPLDSDVRDALYLLIYGSGAYSGAPTVNNYLKATSSNSTQTITMATCTALLASATTLIK